MSIVESLNLIDQGVKKRRAFKKAISQKSELRELWFNCGLKVKAESGQLMFPLVIKQTRREYGEDWLLHLPVGLSEVDVRRRAHKIAAALGGAVEFERVNNLLLMRVMNNELAREYPFKLIDRAKMGIPLAVGYGRGGMVVLDLATAPHLLVGGAPGFGKSAFLHQAAATMLHHGIELYIIDLKRLEFAYLKNHARVITDEGGAVKLLQGLCREMDRRINLLESMSLVKIQDYVCNLQSEGNKLCEGHNVPGKQAADMPFITVIIDELAELQAEPFFESLNRLLRLCRAVGVSIIGSTQRPSVKVLDGDSRAMFAARLCYQVADELNSRMVLGETHPEAAYLPAVPGRGVFRFGNTVQEVQTMYIPIDQAREMLSSVEPVPPEPEPEIITVP